MHLNIRSLRKNFNQLETLLDSCSKHIDIIVLSEINIKKDEVCFYKLEGYSSYAYTRETRRGGGLLIYAKKELLFSSEGDINGGSAGANGSYGLHSFGHSIECMHGRLGCDRYKNVHIIAVYRPPKTNKMCCVSDLRRLLKSIPRGCDVILIGDTNLDLLENVTSGAVTSYKNMLSEYGLQCTFVDITREEVLDGRLVSSCIDHIWVRTKQTVTSFVLQCKISDHYLVGSSIDYSSYECTGSSDQQSAIKSYVLDNKMVNNKLMAIDWSQFQNIICPLALYEKLGSVFINIYNSQSHVKIVKIV